MNIPLYLNVPYSEKEEAKKLGAKWNPEEKKWYYTGNLENYINFAKWLFDIKEQEEITIITDSIYIIESKIFCWKCKKETTIIGLAIEKFIRIYDTECEDEDENPIYEFNMIGFNNNDRGLYVTWIDDEKYFPSFLLNYLKKNYNVKTGFSKIAGKTFANYCEHCNIIQGNNYIFDEFDTPFSLTKDTFEDNIKKIKSMKIKKINLKNNLILNFSYSISGDEYLFLEYGNIEEIIIK